MRAAYNDVVWAAVTTTKKYTTCNQQAGKLTDKHITTTRKPARNPARIAQVADLISIKLYMHNIRPMLMRLKRFTRVVQVLQEFLPAYWQLM